MNIQPQLDFLLDTAVEVFGEDYPLYQNVPLPKPLSNFPKTSQRAFETFALWTKDGLRPRWDNLAAAINKLEEPTVENLAFWRSTADELKIPLVVLSTNNRYLFLSSDQKDVYEATRENLRQELSKQRQRLFSPHNLGNLRSGQLSFADFEETLSESTLAFYPPYRVQLSQVLTNGVNEAIEAQCSASPDMPHQMIVDSVMVTSVAYLAARILDDKGFFGGRRLLVDDPQELLAKVISKTNGFFRYAYQDYLPNLDITALQYLAVNIGNSVSFALVDHYDVGWLYEQAMQIIQKYINSKWPDLTGSQLFDLQQHYTPQAVAERMLKSLPLERLRPDERVIFDPAAGSGSLLLAATRRLASMPDVAMIPDNKNYLAQHVIGNDLDPNAKLLTKLRYTLVQEAFGQQELFPDPKIFRDKDYHQTEAWDLPARPRVIVANPPFATDNGTQRAVRFAQLVTERLQEGDQFAIVLPQTFLTGTTYGWSDVRKTLSKRCHTLETWQFPEGAIGLSARQPACIVLGVVEKRDAKRRGTVARAIVSGAQTEAIRDKGFLGASWITEIAPATDDWATATAPSKKIDIPVIPLDNLFYVCSGVTPRKGIKPVEFPTDETPTKKYWKNGWRKLGTLWADPKLVPEKERYIFYTKEHLKFPSFDNEWVYNSHKIMVGRSINRGSQDPLGVRLDTTEFCPNNDTYCVVPSEADTQTGEQNIEGWTKSSYEEKLFWLLGILSSELAVEMLMSGRDTRHLKSASLRKFPLPMKVDSHLVEVVDEIIQKEKKGKTTTEMPALWERLNQLVETAYGNPERRIKLARTGPLPELVPYEQERSQPAVTVTGQVLDFNPDNDKIHLYLDNLSDDERDAWVALPQELPGWALDGTVFEAQLSRTVETFDDLHQRPWSLRNFKHTPRPYLTLEELQNRLLSKLGL
ncbi:MAG: hypothetical protein FOGNACKC_06292 [Anaerolineae bacterium]|nr:hypothetical protein [Anaerolineae bacterium]